MSNATEQDLDHLRNAIRLSERARLHGNRPFGAVLVAEGGEVLAEAENQSTSSRNLTAHAEMNALSLASKRASAAEIARATMYASGEPCPMCAGAMLQLGVRRVVFGIRHEENRRYYLTDATGVTKANVGCRDILRLAPSPVEVIGPMLEEEARSPFEAFAARGSG